MDDIKGWLAVEKIAAIPRREKRSPIVSGATPSGEVVAVRFSVTVVFHPRWITTAPHPPRVWFANAEATIIIRSGLGVVWVMLREDFW